MFDFLGGHFENCASAFKEHALHAKAKHRQRMNRKRFLPYLTKSEGSL